MSFSLSQGFMRCTRRVVLSLIALCALMCVQAAVANAAIIMSLSKSNNAPNPVQSGAPFTYTITYSYSGATGFTVGTPGTLIITDAIPSNLEIISATGGSVIAPPNVTFTVSGLTLPSGGGTVQINVRFKPGVTCPGDRACNIASMFPKDDPKNVVRSNEDCVTATASNKWQFWKDYISGCVVDSVDEVVYRIAVVNPSGNDIGGLNLTNATLTDLLPAGAIMTSVVAGGSWTATTPASGTVTFTGPTSFTVASGWQWYYVYFKVRYPSPTFTAGQNVTNTATLRFQTPCSGGQYLTMSDNASNTLCSSPISSGAISKWLNLWLYFPANPWYTPSWAPGCCGTYTVYYNNNGATIQSGVVVEDNLPATVDVGNITTYITAPGTSAVMSIYCYVAGVCQAVPAVSIPYATTGTYTPAGLPGPICRIRWTYTGNVDPGEYLYHTINVCVRSTNYATGAPVVAGQNIANTACVTGTNVPAGLCSTTNNAVTPTAPNILAGKFFVGKSGSCMPGCSPNITGPFYPGDVVRFRMVIANVGAATATPCTITDVLPPGFTYVGNPTYSYGPVVWTAYNNPTCCSMTAAPPVVLGGITSPTVGSTTCTWSFPTLPADCSGNVNYLVIDFDIKANNSPTIPPDTYTNTFTFSAGNLVTPVTSNPAYVIINGTAQVQVSKEVRPNISGSPFGPSANVQPGNLAEYRLRIQNTGMLTLTSLNLLDILPWIGDIRVFPPYVGRGSQYNMPLVSAITAVPGYTYSYNTNAPVPSQNPTRSALFPGMLDPGGTTLGVWGALVAGRFSFRINASSPATMIAPGGTQDFIFSTMVPVGSPVGKTACNSFGVEVKPYGMPTINIRTEASPACVTVIPPTKDQCDSIWGPSHADECCSFTSTILGTLGNIAGLGYNVLGGSGVVQSVMTAPCLPSSTIPASLAGTTSGTLIFSPACAGPLGATFHAQSTTASGQVCIELIAYIVSKNGQKVICRDTVCIKCDPAPKQRCDSISVKASLAKNYSVRSFTIYNMKAPVSPICSVKISVTPPPFGGMIGAGLFIDGIAKPWPSGTSAGYTQITTGHGLPANSLVQFNLYVPYGTGWVGNVSIMVYHCDGDSCEVRYGPWDATKGPKIDIGTSGEVPDKATLHMHALTFSRERAADRRIRSIAVHYSEPVTEIVAVTAATYPCEMDEEGGMNSDCNDLIEGVRVQDQSIMIDLRRDLDDRGNMNDPVITVLYRSGVKDESDPTVEIIYYDENGQEVGNDEMAVTGEEPPGRIISGLRQDDRMDAIMGALTARPNPTADRCDVGFTLPSDGTVELEIVDARGMTVAKVINGERMTAGEHHRLVDMATISSGTYMVTLRVNGIPSVLRLQLIK